MIKRVTKIISVAALALLAYAPVLAQADVSECQFNGQPTPAQLQTCQQAAQAAAQGANGGAVAAPGSAGGNGAPAMMPPAGSGSNGMPGNIKTGPSEAQQKQMEAQKMKGMKKGIIQMEKGLTKIETNYNKIEKSGATLPAETKDKLNEVKSLIDAGKSAQTSDELDKVDTEKLQSLMEELGDGVGDLMEKTQKLVGLKKGVKGIEKAVTSFEKQSAKLVKQGVVIPDEVATSLKKVKGLVQDVKQGKLTDESNATLDNLDELMSTINDSRPQLEMAARWPQINKQADKMLADLDKTSKKLKTTVDNLAKKEIDLSENHQKFVDGVSALRSAKEAAAAQMKSGEAEQAFEAMEDNFFSKFDDQMEQRRIIETMAGLGKFSVEYKKAIAQAEKQIGALNKKKVDTTDLKRVFNQAKEQGNEALKLIKNKNADADTILATVEKLEDLKTEFDNQAADLQGSSAMPAIANAPKIDKLVLPPDMMKVIDQKQGQ